VCNLCFWMMIFQGMCWEHNSPVSHLQLLCQKCLQVHKQNRLLLTPLTVQL